MMGHKDKAKQWDETDIRTPWRHVLCWCHKPGAKKRIKTRMNRRNRRAVNRAINMEAYREGITPEMAKSLDENFLDLV